MLFYKLLAEQIAVETKCERVEVVGCTLAAMSFYLFDVGVKSRSKLKLKTLQGAHSVACMCCKELSDGLVVVDAKC